MSTPPERDNKPKYDPRFPEGLGSWRKKRYSDEELDAMVVEKKQAETGQIPAETSEEGLDRNRLYTSGVRGRINISDLLSRKNKIKNDTDQGSEESIKPLVVGLGEEFHAYALPQGPYRGAESVEEALSMWQAKATTVTLHSKVLPDLDFQIVTIPSRAEAGKSEIIIESSIRQTLELGLLHKTGRRAAVFPSWQPYGFNEDVLPLIQRLRFSFIDSESQSEAKPEIRRTGQVQFKFQGSENELTPDLRARFDLAEDPIEEGIKAAAIGDPEEEARLRKSVAENPVLRDFFLHGPTGLSSTAPDFGAMLREVESSDIEASEVKEIYRIGERIPLFRLTPQENNPSGRIRTYTAGFTLATSETPDLAFSVTLGSPKGAPISMSAPKPNQLTVEADLRKLAIEVRDTAACGTFPIEYFYTLDPQMTSVLQRLVLRVYDGEDGKIYEALSDQRDLKEGGSLTFNDNFHEVKLDDDGKVVSRSPRDHSMAYTLQANTGAENTQAELLLLPEEDRLKVLRRPRLPRFSCAL